MGRRGRIPKPSSLKRLLGNPGRRPLNDDEPVPPPGEILPPSFVQPEAMSYWNALSTLLIAMRLLTVADVYALGMLCNLLARQEQLEKFLMRRGPSGTTYVVKDNNGTIIRVAEIPQAWEFRANHGMIINLQREFGLTPASRSRLRVEPVAGAVGRAPGTAATSNGQPADPLPDFFSGGGPRPPRTDMPNAPYLSTPDRHRHVSSEHKPKS
jgi:P27 family predicted phage terminase small subunit